MLHSISPLAAHSLPFASPVHVFTYGTLIFPEIWRAVVGREFASAPAAATGFAVHRVRDGVYPVMIRAEAASRVAGLVYFDVDDAALAALDTYESELYDRMTVTLDAGGTVACQAYVLPPERDDFASGERWVAGRFEREELARIR